MVKPEQAGVSECKHCGIPLRENDLGSVCHACLMAEALAADGDVDVDTALPEPGQLAPNTDSQSVPDPLEGSSLGQDGRYKILQRIGEGGFGVVYMAEQTAPVRRRVAVKVLKAGMDTRHLVARFEAERQALAMMDHPNIAKVLDGGETGQGRPFFVMELVRGTPITTYCDREQFDPEARLGLFMQVCDAVQHAHQKGIIHRDLKPSNILITAPDGAEPVPKVIDFGVAKALESNLTDKTLFTRFEQMIGTPAYMSPEQAGTESGVDIDTRADIYALGVLLYELLTGSTPFEAKTLQGAAFEEVRRILREEEAPRPSARLGSLEAERRTTIARERDTEAGGLGKLLRGDLDWIVMKAIEKDRRRRYETANALVQDVERHLADEPVSAGPPTAAYRSGKFLRRHKAPLAVAATVLFLLVAGITATSWQAIRATAEMNRAVEAEALAEERREEAEAISEFVTGMFDTAKPGAEEGGRTLSVAESLKIAQKNLEADEEISAEQRAVFQKAIGGVYASLGQHKEAIALREKVYQFYDDTHGLKHPDTLGALFALSISYRKIGRGDEALEMQEDVLELSRIINGVEDPVTLNTMNSLANSYADVGRQEDALKMREELLANYRRTLDPEHSNTLRAMYGLATSYHHLGREEEALKMREDGLAVRRRTLDPEHPDIILSMLSLSNSYAASRPEEALALLEEVLALSRKVNGPEHPVTLSAMHNLASSYAEAGRRDEALVMREEGLESRRKVSDPDHPHTLAAMMKLANSYSNAGRGEEALTMREEVLERSRDTMGEEHPFTLGAMNNLANSYGDGGRGEEALKLYEEILKLSRMVFGEEHRDTLEEMFNLTNSYFRAGRRDEALKMGEEALELSRNALGEEDSHTFRIAHNLAIYYADANRWDEAVKLRENVLELYRKMNGTEHSDTIGAMSNLAKMYHGAGLQDKALSMDKEAWVLLGNLPLNTDSPAPAAVLVPPDSHWGWLHPVDGVDPAETDADFHRRFFHKDYDDSKWQRGEDSEIPTGGFGYGDEGFTGVHIGTPVEKALGKSAYFRHRFATEKDCTGLELRCHRDDGIIVYLDGKEVGRDNMEDGEGTYELSAAVTVGGFAETAVFRLPLQGLTLPAGEHVLAISLHNTEAPSSDLRIGGITLVVVE